MPSATHFDQHIPTQICARQEPAKNYFERVLLESTSPARPSWRLLIFLVLVGLTTLVVCTRHNTFPYTYHPDEDTKVRQIVSGRRNFFHPLLLLTTTSAAYHSGLMEKNPLNAAIAGRWVSASFTALSVVALTILAGRWGGWASAWGAAILLVLNPLGFELAHYFKEDAALLFGLSATFLALDVFWKTPRPTTAALLGVASALAISGKYLGAIILLFVLPLLILKSRQNSARLLLWFLGGLVITIIIVDWPLLRHWIDFSNGLGREMNGATGGHRGLSRDVPHAYYLAKLHEITPIGIWAGLGLTSIAMLVAWKKSTATQLLTLLFPFFFLALLSFSPKTATRYVLPATTLFSFLAGLAPGLIMRQSWQIKTRLIFALIALVAVMAGAVASFSVWQHLYADFSTDARGGLRQWIDQKTTPAAIIAQDERVDLLSDPHWKNRQILNSEFVADLGSLDTLRKQNVRYVAVTRQTYNRFFNGLKPNSEKQAEFERRASFYRELFATGNPVWESPVGEIIYLHPGIRLYQIAPDQ